MNFVNSQTHIDIFCMIHIWIDHNLKMDPKKVQVILKNDGKWSFPCVICTFLSMLQHICPTNTDLGNKFKIKFMVYYL